MGPQTATSSIAMALAGQTASVDVPKPRQGLTSAERDHPRSGQPAMLPTPPNSISPTLPPHSVKHRSARHAHSSSFDAFPVDSDIDLGDTAEHVNNHGQSRLAGKDLDSVGAISPALLARYHLPSILLDQGPLPIRHLMGCLTTSVPGFSRIPPAKARRLIVAALECSGSEGGGPQGDVVFEKVGWGRWDARRRGEPSRDHQLSPPSSLSNSLPQQSMQIPSKSAWNRVPMSTYGASMADDSAAFSFSEMGYGGEDVNMLEDEADKMSLDGDAHDNCSSSEAPEEDVLGDDWGEDDITDEEDWAHMGAAALRARSLNGGGGFVGSHVVSQQRQLPQLRGGPVPSTLAKSAPIHPGVSVPDGVVNDKEERAAVEALLRLGST